MLRAVTAAFVLFLSAAALPPRPPAFFDDPVSVYSAAGGEDDVDEDGPPEPGEAESESKQPGGPDTGLRYSTDLSDDELRRLWTDDLEALGSISVGFADQGRLINAVRMPQDEAWICQRPEVAFGTEETVNALALVFREVHKQFPGSLPARLSHIGAAAGGYLRPHRSHQSGRDADIGLFYKDDKFPRAGARRERLMDPARNWALLRALVTLTDVQVILVDRGIQKILRAYALSGGEDPAFVASLLGGGKSALVQHARRHKDHFHVRFYAPRSQELGRRIQPLLAERPEQNIALHRVKHGETLGQIARVNNTTVALIRKVNHLHGSFLHLGQQLRVPLRGPCTRCPLPPAVVVPPRRVPAVSASAVATSAG
jgi:murein endopeptidase